MRKAFAYATIDHLAYEAPMTTVYPAVSKEILGGTSITIDGSPSGITFEEEEEGDGEDIATNSNKLWDV